MGPRQGGGKPTAWRTISPLTRVDPGAVDEKRFVTLGLSNLGNLLVVVFTYREPDIIRVISGWKANKTPKGGL